MLYFFQISIAELPPGISLEPLAFANGSQVSFYSKNLQAVYYKGNLV